MARYLQKSRPCVWWQGHSKNRNKVPDNDGWVWRQGDCRHATATIVNKQIIQWCIPLSADKSLLTSGPTSMTLAQKWSQLCPLFRVGHISGVPPWLTICLISRSTLPYGQSLRRIKVQFHGQIYQLCPENGRKFDLRLNSSVTDSIKLTVMKLFLEYKWFFLHYCCVSNSICLLWYETAKRDNLFSPSVLPWRIQWNFYANNAVCD